ncbi:MAG: Mrp/NBP35 family ATP-binding protein [Planctomycetes bacterium]|nr:Mrp/NBP35 family ATP-binding protein [Planctomycetota bacterium]
MTDVSREAILTALASIRDPDRGRDLVQAGAIRELRIEGDAVHFLLALQRTGTDAARETHAAAERAVMGVPGVGRVNARLVNAPPEKAGQLPERRPIPGVRHVIAVSSGKGGVGKSTVCVNLACAVAAAGAHVGILDGDIYGPNIPLMLGAKGQPEGTSDRIFPLVAHGLQLMSMGLLVGEDQPMVWRGPMLNKAVTQFMFQVDWHDLDYLFVDLPPGTGDVQLTLTQNTQLSGAVVVTTPQDVAVLDVRKAIRMFEKIGTPVLGVVENMSWFQPPGSDDRYEIFGSGGGARIEREFGVPLLGQIPIGIEVRTGGDTGQPIVVAQPDSPIAAAFRSAAQAMLGRLQSA